MGMRELVDELNVHAYRYYVLDEPTISDREYDELYDKLLLLEKEEGYVLEDSPSRRVGGALLDGFVAYRHRERLYSLDKCQNYPDLEEWVLKISKDYENDFEYTLEYKYDGLTLNIEYKNGYLVRATTRGNGIEGEDVTQNAKTINTIPLSIPYKGLIEVQGEVIMRLSALNKYNETHEEPLKNARNAAAGAIRNLNPKITRERNLDFVAYNIGHSRDKVFHTQQEMHDFLIENKFYVGEYYKLLKNTDDLFKSLSEIENNRSSLDFLIDGAVLKINDIDLRDRIGYTEKFPKWAMAYKFKAEEVTTILKDVIWQISRTGKLNPLAILEPVDIAGVCVQRCTLSNYSEIQRKKLKIGSRVIVRRSNDVIPEILGVSEYYDDDKEIVPPNNCPYCGSELYKDGVFIKCANMLHCAPAVIARLSHFTSKEAMDIEGLSDKTIELLYNELQIKTISDLYKIKKEQLLNLEGIKEKKADNIINAIKSSKSSKLDSFIYGLGIPNIGKKASRELVKHFGTLENIMKANEEELLTLPDFGNVMVQDILNYFNNSDNLDEINSLLDLGLSFKIVETTGKLAGLKFVVTGTLLTMKRSQVHNMIIANGGDVSNSISKNINYLIAGDNAGSKLDKAKKLGINIITEEEFIKLCND